MIVFLIDTPLFPLLGEGITGNHFILSVVTIKD